MATGGRFGTILAYQKLNARDYTNQPYLITLEATVNNNTITAALVLYCTWDRTPFNTYSSKRYVSINNDSSWDKQVDNSSADRLYQYPWASTDWSTTRYTITFDDGTTKQYKRSVLMAWDGTGQSGNPYVYSYSKNITGTAATYTVRACYNPNINNGFVPLKGEYNLSGSVTLTRYSTAYNLNGGSGTSSTQYHVYNTAFTTHGVPTRTGYTFSYWAGSNGSTYSANTSYTVNQNITLTAQWSANSYYLDLNGQLDGADQPSLVDYGTVNLTVGGADKGVVQDYYTQHTYGTSYQFTNPQAKIGYMYNGLASSSAPLSGSIGAGTVDVRLSFNTLTLTVNERSVSSLALSWNRGAAGDQYNIYYRSSSSTGAYSLQECGDTGAWTLGLAEDTTYSLYVEVKRGNTVKGRSADITASTLMNPPTINSFTNTALTPFTATVHVDAAPSRSSRTLQYAYSSDNGAHWTAFSSSSDYTFTGLQEETTYNLKVKVKQIHQGQDSQDTETVSNILTVTTPADQAQIWRHNGSNWQKGKAFVFDNNTWKKAKKIYRYDGSNWVVNKNN